MNVNAQKIKKEPTEIELRNKRTAQNRAAQRAFRERKERKMKDLESKVKNLEKVIKDNELESEFLRGQLILLANELKKQSKFSSHSNTLLKNRVNSISSNQFNTPKSSSFSKSISSFPYNTTTTNSSPLSVSFPSPSNVNSIPDNNNNSTFNSDFLIDGNNNDLKMMDASASPSKDLLPTNNNNNNNNNSPATLMISQLDVGLPSNMISNDWWLSQDILSTDNNNTNPIDTSLNDDNNINNNILPSNDLSTIDYKDIPIDLLPIEEDPLLKFSLSDVQTISMNDSFDEQISKFCQKLNSACRLPPTTTKIVNEAVSPISSTPSVTPMRTNVNSVLAFPDAFSVKSSDSDFDDDDDDDELVVPADPEMLPCTKIWDRITALPKYTESDIDSLCDELMSKAKCSDKGVVVSAGDVDKVLRKEAHVRQKS